jgi:nitrite reductase/ring-hydroxylating ferredoxin subunit
MRSRWYPVVRSQELPAREIFHARLLGQELALWRDDGGSVNAWENRCPHRGQRFTAGYNLGAELACRYHGWRFASGSGQCIAIPAHPDFAPPKAICATVFATAEKGGYVWASLGHPESGPLPTGAVTTLRSIVVHAPLDAVEAALPRDSALSFLLQPADARKTVIHAFLKTGACVSEQRTHNARLCALRDALE